MEPIELSRWEPSPEDPRRKQYAGQRTAQEVFEELRHRLEGMGYLPDEYFLMNRDWENGREIPRGADIFCTTDYGGSEGIYLDVSLQWYENDRTVTRNFITGKTLGETGADLDRMFLISSAITKAFHGDRGTYARYLSCGEQPEPEAMIVHLDPAEQRTIIQALAMLVIHGSAAETKDYERAIILIGSAWGLDPQNAVSHLELITREKEAARGTAEPEETRHVLPESELPMNASGMETLDNVCGLFETAIQLESRDHREALFRLASKLMETQNLLDWIEKTPEEQELPELAES